jgi:ATP-dependent DNA helicase RecG
MNDEAALPPPLQLTLNYSPLELATVDEIYHGIDEGMLSILKEDRRIERKPAGIHARELGEYFSMWANTSPEGGLIAIGVADGGTLAGCSSLSTEQVNELERTGDVYCPDAKYDTPKRIAIRRSSDGKPDYVICFRIYYRTDKVVKTSSGNAYTRRGSSKTKLTPEEMLELERDKRQIDLELEPCNLEYPQAFSIDSIKQFTAAIRESFDWDDNLADSEVLELRRLGKRENKKFKPNNACALLFARDPIAIFPGCKIRFLRFEGTFEGTGERWNAVKDIVIEGNIPFLVLEAERILDQQLRTFSKLGADSKFYTAPEYPKPAWYEAVVNACVHRSYGLRNMPIFIKMFDNRLVIESPGGFPPLVTPQNIYDVHHPRNPHLMSALQSLKFVKCAHEGTRRIRDTMAAMSLPAPTFEQKDVGSALVKVTLQNGIEQRKVWIDSEATTVVEASIFKTLDANERRVINFIAESGTINVSQVQRLTQMNWPRSNKLLKKLVERGILTHVHRKGLDRDPQAHYRLKKEKDDKSEKRTKENGK